MNSSEIDIKLRDKFQSHKYALSNSYVYNWESDFFSITTTGYAQEVEIKVSLSDFRADFKKIDKHTLLESKMKGEKSMLFRGRNIYKIKYQQPQFVIDSNGRRIYDEETKNWKKIPGEKIYEKEIQTDNIQYFTKYYMNVETHHISCGINIHPLNRCPNKFWYCCPEGVIPESEVPEYAGLYYISENMRMKVIKKAPFIHKEKQDLTQVLLDKFYWESINLRRSMKIMEMRKEKIY